MVPRNNMEKSLLKFAQKYEKIICYGAGEFGFYVAVYLNAHGIDIGRFLVSNKSKNVSTYLGINMCQIAEFEINNIEKIGIILSVSEKNHKDIEKVLNKYGNFHVYPMKLKEIEKIKKEILSIEKSEFVRSLTYLANKKILSSEVEKILDGIETEQYQTKLKKLWKVFSQEELLEKENEYLLLKGNYENYPRYTELSINALNGKLLIPDIASFLSTYKEIIINKIYEFQPKDPENIQIVDIGANIGLSVIFFYQNYPLANIEAYEADPSIYKVLCKNISNYNCDNIQIYNKAVWDENTVLQFYAEGADGGHIENNLTVRADKVISVETIDVIEILQKYKKIDFLKIDIEGAEVRVLSRANDYLKNVENIFVEYHSIAGVKQEYHVVIKTLAEAGFRIYTQTSLVSEQPFKKCSEYNGYDFLVNIFGVRP